jgi:hypothetical protein
VFTIPSGTISGIAGRIPASTSDICSKTAIGLGVGIGVPLVLLVIVLGALFMMERKKRITAEHGDGYADAGQKQYSGEQNQNGTGAEDTQVYSDASTELNAHEVHEMGHCGTSHHELEDHTP